MRSAVVWPRKLAGHGKGRRMGIGTLFEATARDRIQLRSHLIETGVEKKARSEPAE
jgi:hypothetical protein